jgi:hypothetical protein
MACSLSLTDPHEGLAHKLDHSQHAGEPSGKPLRILAELRRRARIAAARAGSGLLKSLAAEGDTAFGAHSAGGHRIERCQQATPLGAVIELPDLPAAVGRIAYPGYPGAVVRFTRDARHRAHVGLPMEPRAWLEHEELGRLRGAHLRAVVVRLTRRLHEAEPATRTLARSASDDRLPATPRRGRRRASALTDRNRRLVKERRCHPRNQSKSEARPVDPIDS